jgi:SAM-dependent methyltransferase
MIEIRHKSIQTPADEIDAYNQLYDANGIRHLDSFYLWILNLLDARPGQTLLDVSSGEGSLVYFALEHGLRASGIDFSPVALRKGVEDYKLTSTCVSDAECLPVADHSFDLVTNIGSVEHYFEPEVAIQEMSRVLKPQGKACILVPNTFSLFGNVQYVWQTGDVFDDGQPIQRYNTRLGWHRLLVENGLEPYKTLKYEQERPRTFKDCLWYIRRPSKVLKLLLSPLIPTNLANSIVYLCHPEVQYKVKQT